MLFKDGAVYNRAYSIYNSIFISSAMGNSVFLRKKMKELHL